MTTVTVVKIRKNSRKPVISTITPNYRDNTGRGSLRHVRDDTQPPPQQSGTTTARSLAEDEFNKLFKR